jgi:hypothetical protein
MLRRVTEIVEKMIQLYEPWYFEQTSSKIQGLEINAQCEVIKR